MNSIDKYNYIPLKDPIPISEQIWPEGTLPLVATGTLTYNHEPYIHECLDGILMQKTTFPVRITIFEDASTDKTSDIVKEYADKYPGLIFAFCQNENTYGKGEIRQKAREPYEKARNIAKYIALCEGDDYWTDPLKLQKQVEFLEQHSEFALCFHNAQIIFEYDESHNKPFTLLNQAREYSGEEILMKWTIPTASVVYRQSMYERVTHPDIIYGDILLFLTLAHKGKLWGMNEIMSAYRKHEGGTTILIKNNKLHNTRYIKHMMVIRNLFNGKYKNAVDFVLWQRFIGNTNTFNNNNKLTFTQSVKIKFLIDLKILLLKQKISDTFGFRKFLNRLKHNLN